MTTSQQSNAGNKDAPDPIAEAKMLMPVLKQSLVVRNGVDEQSETRETRF